MDPESFFNWDAMDEDMDIFEGTSFLNSNFDRSAFTEAIIHPSMSQIQNRDSKRDLSYIDEYEYELESEGTRMNNTNSMYNYTNQPNSNSQLMQVKQEPGINNSYNMNYFNDYVPSPSSFVSPHAITPNSAFHPNHVQQQSFSNQIPSSPTPFQTTKIFNDGEKYRPPPSPLTSSSFINSTNQSPLSPINSNMISTQQTQTTTTNSNSDIDIVIGEQPPVEVRTRTPGENRLNL